MAPRFFATAAEFRKWLSANHQKAEELLVGFHKVDSGRPSMSWKESVDEALCFGWIDGVRRRIDESSYTVRFTPRRPKSIWSAINVKRMKELLDAGLVAPAGQKVFEARDPARTGLYSFEAKDPSLSPEFETAFKKNRAAWRYFDEEAPWYRRTASHWVMSAKKEETRQRRLETLIADSAAGRRIKALTAKR